MGSQRTCRPSRTMASRRHQGRQVTERKKHVFPARSLRRYTIGSIVDGTLVLVDVVEVVFYTFYGMVCPTLQNFPPVGRHSRSSTKMEMASTRSLHSETNCAGRARFRFKLSRRCSWFRIWAGPKLGGNSRTTAVAT